MTAPPRPFSFTLTRAGGTVSWTYDNDYRVSSTAVNGASLDNRYDADSLLVGAGTLTINREATTGRVHGTTLGAVGMTYTYDTYGDLSGASGTGAGYSYTLDRDASGRIVGKTETIQGVTTRYGYDHDEAGRLEVVTVNGAQAARYAYDENGDRLTRTTSGGTVSSTYDAQDRLLASGATTYTHGPNGELTTKTAGGATTAYDYDAFGNLRAAWLPDGRAIEYVVDGLNRRVGKRVNGSLVEGFLYEGQLRPVAWLDGSGQVYARFVYGLHVNVPEYMVTAEGTFRFLTDHLGSPRLVVNASTGAVVQRIDYDEWGVVLADSNPGFQPFGFAGGLYDRDTGLVRFGARDYDPAVGRWTAKDPVGFEGGLNFYEYCGGDPVNFVDPEGHSWAGVRRTLGVIWGAPQELIGILYGGAGWLLGGDATFSNNGILFENNPIQLALGGENSAITLGHSMCLASRGDFIRSENGYSTAAHEEQHTYQSEVAGPFYLPAAGVSLLVGALVDGDSHGPHSFMETGPQSSPPRPWPWGGK